MSACATLEPGPSASCERSREGSPRLRSIDVLRGLTILVMMFVNDVAGVKGAPGWMKHIDPPSADGMTFVDVVFPAFLFIVGMAAPFALGRRLEKGDSAWVVWRHVLVRALGLIVIGFFMVNTETMVDGPLSKPVWTLLMYASAALVWLSVFGGSLPLLVRLLGVVGLFVLAFLYRGNGAEGVFQMRPQWWGILGLIGWAYLAGGTAYLLVRNSVGALVGVAALLFGMHVANAAGNFGTFNELVPWIDLGGALGSLAGVVVCGIAIGVVIRRLPLEKAIAWAAWYGLGLALMGMLLHSAASIHPMFFYNKIAGTVPWCLLSSAFTVWTWCLVAWLTDVRMYRRGCGWLSEAGKNALLAYVLAPVVYALLAVVGLSEVFWGLGEQFWTGFARSVVFAVGITWVAAWLSRRGVMLRL